MTINTNTQVPVDLEVNDPMEERRLTIGALIGQLVLDASRSYLDIVNAIIDAFPDAKTTTRSVASVAARLRKTGRDLPLRRGGKAEA